MHVRADELAEWLRIRVATAGARGLVLPLSDDLNAAVVAGLCARATPGRVVGVTDAGDGDDAARAVAHAFGIATVPAEPRPAAEHLAATLDAALAACRADSDAGAPADARSALEARLRMAVLYHVAAAMRYLVAGTLDRFDLTVGRFTKHGEGAADLFPLGNLPHAEVKALARDLEVPAAIIDASDASPRRIRGADEGDLALTHDALERYLAEGPEGVPPALALRIERLIRRSEHKRAPGAMPGAEPF